MSRATRKVREALLAWRKAPNQVETDLLPTVDILDWHRGTRDQYGTLKLSSRRLLALLRDLPESSAYRTLVERGGDWDETMFMWGRMATLLDRIFASYLAVHRNSDDDSEPYEPFVWRSPIQLREHNEQLAAEAAEELDDVETLYSDFGFD